MAPSDNSGSTRRGHLRRATTFFVALALPACSFFGDVGSEIPFTASDAGSADDGGPSGAVDGDEPNVGVPCTSLEGGLLPAPGETAGDAICGGGVHTWTGEFAAGEHVVIDVTYPREAALFDLELTPPRGVAQAGQPIWNDAGVRFESLLTEDGRYELSVSSRPTDASVAYEVTVTTTAPAGEVYYLSPTGSDDDDGSAESPWQTLRAGTSRLRPGDTLILEDGIWQTHNCTGDDPCVEADLFDVNCDGGAGRSGTAGGPITVVARNERRAMVRSDGLQTPVVLRGCSHWRLVGLRIEAGDNPDASTAGHPLLVDTSPSTTLRRLLVRAPNRYGNSHGILVIESPDTLVEEVEVYDFHRSAVRIDDSPGSAIRRSYVHSRSRSDLPGGYESIASEVGDGGFGSGDARWVENVAAENVNYGVQPFEPATDRTIAGSICNDCRYGYVIGGAEDSIGPIEFLDVAAFRGSGGPLIYLRACEDCLVRGATLMRESDGGTGVRVDRYLATDRVAVAIERVLAVGNERGFRIIEQDEWSIDSSNAWESTLEDYPADDDTGSVTNSLKVEPTDLDFQDGCLAYVPTSSNMSGAAADGEDIGANLVYRYHDGAPTTDRLWNQVNGRFPCGAVVEGVNDRAGASCFDFHERVNIATDACPVP